MKTTKRIISLMLALLCIVSVFSTTAPSVFAATSSTLVAKIKPLLPITCYAMPSSGASRIYAYNSVEDVARNNSLKGYYVDPFSVKEVVVITDISSDGKAIKLRYLSSNGAPRDKWFRTDDVLGLNIVSLCDFQASAAMTVNRMSSASAVTKYGTISKGSDICYKLGSHKVGNTTYNTVIYKLTASSTVNGITVRYKMGLVSQNTYNSYAKSVSGNGNNNSSYSTKVSEFLNKSQYKNGATWGANKTPMLSSYSSKGCCAYTADFVKYVFGKNSPRGGTYFTNINDIKAGDVIVLNNPHWFVVLERYSDGRLKVAEGNVNNGKVRVSDSVYKIQNGNLYSWGSQVTTFNCGYHFT